MDLKTNRISIQKILLIIFSSFPLISFGQQTPLNTDSYWVFVPYIYNPAMTGSKDFLTIGFNSAFQGESNTQLLSGNQRISRTHNGYFSSPDITKFTNFGLGAAVFNDKNGLSSNYGISIAGSYQIPLNTRELSFLSFGAALKETHNKINTTAPGVQNPLRTTLYTNADLGVYYYGTSIFAGVSGVNLLGSPWKPDTLGIYNVPAARIYYFNAGLKLLLSKSFNVVLEPSVLVSATDSTFNKVSKNIVPILKLYLDNFCAGATYRGDGKMSFFAQYNYPHFFVGGYYGFKSKTPYFKEKPVVEFTMGLKIQPQKLRSTRNVHW
jgi:type IX secretion system PorP/SprF family membrane protein